MEDHSIENLPEVLKSVRTRPLMVLKLVIAPPQIVGKSPRVSRLVGVALSGTFEGERLSGEVLPGGSDWQVVGDNGSAQLNCRLILKTDDGELISIQYQGVRSNPPAVVARIAKGESVSPDEYYLRITPIFETASEKYGWLNNVIAVGIGDRREHGPTYSIHEVL